MSKHASKKKKVNQRLKNKANLRLCYIENRIAKV